MRCFSYLFICLLLVGCDSPKTVIKLGDVLPLGGEFQIYGLQGLIQIDNMFALLGPVSSAARNAMAGQQLYSEDDLLPQREDHHFDLPMYLAEFHQGELGIIRKLGLIIPQDQRQAALTP